MTRKTISLCMIVKDEEAHLADCLASARAQVDEIIVVDTGSQDRTAEIAREFGASVHHFAWIQDFAAARNHALEQATCDYVLHLDADERLEPGTDLQASFRQEADCYIVRIKNIVDGAPAIFHPAIRLFRQAPDIRYQGAIHERLNVETAPDDAYSTGYATFQIEHLGYSDEMMTDRDKVARNYEILAAEVKRDPSGYNLYNMGVQCKAMGEMEQALDYFRRAFGEGKEKAYLFGLLYHMGDCLLHLKRYEDGIRLMEDSLASFPHYTDFAFMQGRLYEEAGYLKDAELMFRRCLELGEVEYLQSYEGVGSYLAHLRLGEVLLKQRRKTDALEHAYKTIRLKKEYVPGIGLYLRILMQSGIGAADAHANLQQVYPITEGAELLALCAAMYALRHPLLLRYLQEYQPRQTPDVRAAAFQYAGEERQALAEWHAADALREDQVPDVLALSLVLGDVSLLERAHGALNVSHKEWQALAKIVRGEPVAADKVPETTVRLLLEISGRLLKMGAFDAFEGVSRYLLQSSPQAKHRLAVLLTDIQQYDAAADLLLPLWERKQATPEILHLLAEICLATGRQQDALTLYLQEWEKAPCYPALEGVYRTFELAGDEAGMSQARAEIRRHFPLSKWA